MATITKEMWALLVLLGWAGAVEFEPDSDGDNDDESMHTELDTTEPDPDFDPTLGIPDPDLESRTLARAVLEADVVDDDVPWPDDQYLIDVLG